MPIFEYKCQNCHHRFEQLVLASKTSNEPQCPKCQSKNLSKLMSLGNVRPQGIPKGSGGFNVPQCINNEQEREHK